MDSSKSEVRWSQVENPTRWGDFRLRICYLFCSFPLLDLKGIYHYRNDVDLFPLDLKWQCLEMKELGQTAGVFEQHGWGLGRREERGEGPNMPSIRPCLVLIWAPSPTPSLPAPMKHGWDESLRLPPQMSEGPSWTFGLGMKKP